MAINMATDNETPFLIMTKKKTSKQQDYIVDFQFFFFKDIHNCSRGGRQGDFNALLFYQSFDHCYSTWRLMASVLDTSNVVYGDRISKTNLMIKKASLLSSRLSFKHYFFAPFLALLSGLYAPSAVPIFTICSENNLIKIFLIHNKLPFKT